ncbi:MAG: hypothetical protein HY897_07895 [Deltaproteobacteria bacterium]|nr:hypothetical protein [Deltaproteobacteria bacterium]
MSKRHEAHRSVTVAVRIWRAAIPSRPTLLLAFALSIFSCAPSPAFEGGACEKAGDCAEGLLCLGRVCRHERGGHATDDSGSVCRPDCTHKCDGLPDGCGGVCTQPCDWMKVPAGSDNPPVPDYAAMVYDSRQERTVLFINRNEGWIEMNETWERSKAGWKKMNPRHQPRDGLTGYAVAYDRDRGNTVLFGGGYPENSNVFVVDETWTWDGEDWHLESPSFRPPARFVLAMAYDENRGRVVLYGGDVHSDNPLSKTCLSDTWEWDGREWHIMRPVTSPPCRLSESVAYDPVRKKVVLFGGYDEVFGPYPVPSRYFNDLWEWDGEAWTETTPENPPEFERLLVTYDANRRKLFIYPGAPSLVTFWFGPWIPAPGGWELDGNSFNWIELPGGEFAGFGYGMSFDESTRRLVLFGMSRQRLNDTLEWEDNGWQPSQLFVAPTARSGAHMGFDNRRGVIVLLGGSGHRPANGDSERGETWEWDGHVWRLRNPVDRPPEAEWRAMVYDDVRGHMLLYNSGCHAEGGSCGETWTWDGNAWWRLATAHSPGERRNAAMAFDSARGRAVLFGGSGISGGVNDAHTWEFDGEDWVVRRTPQNPEGRTGHAMVYDKKRGRAVMFGGEGSETFRDTWEWDGETWTKAADDGEPEGDFFFAMAYDSARARVLLHGSYLGRTDNDSMETWEWDGRSWRRLVPSNRPSAWYGFAMAYDSWRDRLVLFGGSPDGRWNLDETWEFGAQ